MTCPACAGHAHSGYRRGRPVPCRKCRGTGWIGERDLEDQEDHEAFIAARNAGLRSLRPVIERRRKLPRPIALDKKARAAMDRLVEASDRLAERLFYFP